MHTHTPVPAGSIDHTQEHAHRKLDMHHACTQARSMPTTIQIRNVPDNVHRRLKSRAALAGLSLSEFMLREATRVADYPTNAELRARLDTLPKHGELTISAAQAIRDER